MKSRGSKIVLITILVLAVICSAGVFVWYRYDQQTYLRINGTKYLRSSDCLDLSGKPLTEVDKLFAWADLRELNLRDTGITVRDYERLKIKFPDCRILWSVPVQDGYVSDDATSLELESLNGADVTALTYLTQLKTLHLRQCQDYEPILRLMEAKPDCQISYTVNLGGTAYSSADGVAEVTVENPDIAELRAKLPAMPWVTRVNLTGTLPATADLVALKEEMPKITFVWTLNYCGVSVDTLTETVDLSEVKVASVEQLEESLACFYNLKQVYLGKCGLKNEALAELNARYEDTKFVWKVNFGPTWIRTDVTFFMPFQYGLMMTDQMCVNMKYLTELVVLDMGHRNITNCSFLEYMPHLQYLILGDTHVKDLTPVGNLKELKFLEVFMTEASDYWPLVNCTALEDLCLGYNRRADPTPLMQMTWLDRLMIPGSRLTKDQKQALKDALPNTIVVTESSSSTDKGWRNGPNYYFQREYLGMHNMVG